MHGGSIHRIAANRVFLGWVEESWSDPEDGRLYLHEAAASRHFANVLDEVSNNCTLFASQVAWSRENTAICETPVSNFPQFDGGVIITQVHSIEDKTTRGTYTPAHQHTRTHTSRI